MGGTRQKSAPPSSAVGTRVLQHLGCAILSPSLFRSVPSCREGPESAVAPLVWMGTSAGGAVGVVGATLPVQRRRGRGPLLPPARCQTSGCGCSCAPAGSSGLCPSPCLRRPGLPGRVRAESSHCCQSRSSRFRFPAPGMMTGVLQLCQHLSGGVPQLGGQSKSWTLPVAAGSLLVGPSQSFPPPAAHTPRPSTGRSQTPTGWRERGARPL